MTLVHFGRPRQWYTLADHRTGILWYTLADYAWYTLADCHWYSLADATETA